ncbi:MAG: MBL fold metallo-hydrolase [Pseudomonadota bacterium]
MKQLSPDCFAFLQREEPGQSNLSVSNYGVVIGPTSLLAIDAGGGPQHARNFLAAISKFNKPIDRLVITHEHPDHIYGMSVFPQGLEVVSQAETRSQMSKLSPNTPALWQTNRAWGLPTDRLQFKIPTVTFTERMSVYYGDTQVDFWWPGRCHTSGDAIIHLPKEKIAFLGDIAFFNVTPLNGSGFVEDWIKVCNRLIADPTIETIVPGHGPTGGKRELAEMRDYLVLLLNEGRKGIAAGLSAGRAAAQADLGKYANWTDSSRIANNMARLYTELRGTIGVDTDREAAQAALAEYSAIKSGR